jgi:hypothetical protein
MSDSENKPLPEPESALTKVDDFGKPSEELRDSPLDELGAQIAAEQKRVEDSIQAARKFTRETERSPHSRARKAGD